MTDPIAERDEIRAEIRKACPGQPLAYGIDGRGCYARIGGVLARSRDINTALRDALAKAREACA